MPRPSEDDVRTILRDRGAAEHVIRGGAEGLIGAWRRFAAQVEHGYPLGLEDYRNDLDIRTLIAVAGLASEVAGEDERFRRMMSPAGRAVWPSDVPDAFWTMGYPSNAAGPLLDDLRAEGFL
jgi:hypothetical protein